MTYFLPDIIDNATTIFAEALEQTILRAEQRQLDIATGYFAPRSGALSARPLPN